MQPAPPCPAPACWWQTQVTGLVLHWQLRILWVFFSLSQLCCPLRFPTDPPVRGFPTVWKLLLLPTPSPGQVSIPNSFVSFSFTFCPTSFRRKWAAFLGAWCPLPAFRSCFGEVAQHSNDILMNLLRRKWSPLPILPLSLDRPLFVFISF